MQAYTSPTGIPEQAQPGEYHMHARKSQYQSQPSEQKPDSMQLEQMQHWPAPLHPQPALGMPSSIAAMHSTQAPTKHDTAKLEQPPPRAARAAPPLSPAGTSSSATFRSVHSWLQQAFAMRGVNHEAGQPCCCAICLCPHPPLLTTTRSVTLAGCKRKRLTVCAACALFLQVWSHCYAEYKHTAQQLQQKPTPDGDALQVRNCMLGC